MTGAMLLMPAAFAMNSDGNQLKPSRLVCGLPSMVSDRWDWVELRKAVVTNKNSSALPHSTDFLRLPRYMCGDMRLRADSWGYGDAIHARRLLLAEIRPWWLPGSYDATLTWGASGAMRLIKRKPIWRIEDGFLHLAWVSAVRNWLCARPVLSLSR